MSVASIIAKLSLKSTELFHNGDDRLMSLLRHLLPCALLVHDPRGSPVGKSVTSCDDWVTTTWVVMKNKVALWVEPASV